MKSYVEPGPTTGREPTEPTSSDIVSPAERITFSVSGAWGGDARCGRTRVVRYRSDPSAGIWRGDRDGRRQISPFAVVGVAFVPGSGTYEIATVCPQTGGRQAFQGSLDAIASAVWRAGTVLGCDAGRQDVYWAIRNLIALVQRWARVEGVGL